MAGYKKVDGCIAYVFPVILEQVGEELFFNINHNDYVTQSRF